ncbi:FGGY-family carbohydrate kinase [Thalassotalea sp. PLHSN55]|uniref:FGGY-family carbohydrate kinase n=1 Tax=Thalassotalea sp. PLHSN55 TaxID=3435888 RepID=UPI003F837C68
MTNTNKNNTVIIDIGKTNIKLHVLDKDDQPLFAKQMSNTVDTSGIYPCACVDDIWQWLCDTIKSVTPQYPISSITITTHGATAALIDRNVTGGNGLVLPVLDYEFANIYQQSPDYDQIRPQFNQTYSPNLPAGLNLGRQLFWLKETFDQAFSSATDILMYPQYWAWRFTGQCYSEITSLGCHTDLWSIEQNDYSSLVDELDCRELFPPMKPAWHNCGEVSAAICEQLGLDKNCRFYNGLHDSNASFLRYRMTQKDNPFTVVSTGTWTILMASQVPLANLDASKDMLANVDALGTPIACARFMGGREFEAVCTQAGGVVGEQFRMQDITSLIEQEVFALPDFSDGSGPFGGQQSELIGEFEHVNPMALATVYCALMIDYQLTKLAAKGDIFIEGAFLKNPLMCALLNQLRSQQDVYLSLDETGTVLGAACLTHWQSAQANIETQLAQTSEIKQLDAYKNKWLNLIEKRM